MYTRRFRRILHGRFDTARGGQEYKQQQQQPLRIIQ